MANRRIKKKKKKIAQNKKLISQLNTLTQTSLQQATELAQNTAFFNTQQGSSYNYDPLDDLRSDLRGIIFEANYRIGELEHSGFESYALDKFHEEHPGANRFDISRLTTYEDIISEATKASVFLSDKTSMVYGAERYTQELSYVQYLGEFGNNFYNFENKYRRYNTKIISDEFARFTFRAYRMLEESEQARIMEYGSDTMVAAMYDMVIKSGYVDTDSNWQLEEIMHQGSDLLDRELGYKKEQFEEAFKEANSVNYMLNVVKLRGKGFYEL